MASNHSLGTTYETGQACQRFSFGIVKPHAYEHREEIAYMIRDSGLAIPVQKSYQIPRNIAMLHYEDHNKMPFFHDIVGMMTVGPSELMIIEGENAINRLSILTGETDPREAATGTIRDRFGIKDDRIMYNAFHRSDSEESMRREVYLYFGIDELPNELAKQLDLK